MRPIQFLLSCIALFVLLALSYAVAVDQLIIPDDEIPFPYRQFLLEATGPIAGKVVIDSGSNGIHSFDTKILSEYFKAPVIIVSDSAGNPVKYKIYNLERHLNPGDILILPLEWSSYNSDKSLSAKFVENVILNEHAYDYYINKLPLIERFEFILKRLPLSMVIDSLLIKAGETEPTTRNELESLRWFAGVLRKRDNRSFGGETNDGPEEPDAIASSLSCDTYLFGTGKKGDLGEVSRTFLSNLDLLGKLAEKGVSIYFTWPTVVDSEESACYKSPGLREGLEQFSASIKESVESYGFQFLGAPEDSHFDSSCFLNTYYHIRSSCTQSRTHAFTQLLRKHAVAPLNSAVNTDEMVEKVDTYIKTKRRLVLEKKARQLAVLGEGVFAPSDQEKKLLFRSGWSETTDEGTWSIGKESVFQLRLAPELLDQEYVSVGIDGHYFNGSENTEIEINGVSYGARILKDQSFRIPRNEIPHETLLVRLQHSDVRSPRMLGKSEDSRMIKFRLQDLSLGQSNRN